MTFWKSPSNLTSFTKNYERQQADYGVISFELNPPAQVVCKPAVAWSGTLVTLHAQAPASLALRDFQELTLSSNNAHSIGSCGLGSSSPKAGSNLNT